MKRAIKKVAAKKTIRKRHKLATKPKPRSIKASTASGNFVTLKSNIATRRDLQMELGRMRKSVFHGGSTAIATEIRPYNSGIFNVYIDYQYLPIETLIEINQIILDTFNTVCKAWGLDKMEGFDECKLVIESFHTGSLTEEVSGKVVDKFWKTALGRGFIIAVVTTGLILGGLWTGVEIATNYEKYRQEHLKTEQQYQKWDEEQKAKDLKALQKPHVKRKIKQHQEDLKKAVTKDYIDTFKIDRSPLEEHNS